MTGILKEQKDFYEELYDIDKDVNFYSRKIKPLLSSVPKKLYNKGKNLQIHHRRLIHKQLKEMNNNKTPGSDGIPVDFYKVFWKELRDIPSML